MKKRILPELGDIPLKDLTRLDVTSWYTKLAATLAEEARLRTWHGQEKSDGRGALYSAYQTLSSILNDAVDHELLDASPAKVKGALRYRDLVPGPRHFVPEAARDELVTLHRLAHTQDVANVDMPALRAGPTPEEVSARRSSQSPVVHFGEDSVFSWRPSGINAGEVGGPSFPSRGAMGSGPDERAAAAGVAGRGAVIRFIASVV